MEVIAGLALEEELADVLGRRVAGQAAALAARQKAAVALDELAELHAHRVAHLADADRLQHAGVAQLFQHDGQIEAHRRLVVVGLDAAHEPRVALGHGLEQRVQRVVEARRHRGRARLHRDEPAVALVHHLARFVRLLHVLEHVRYHLPVTTTTSSI